MQRYKLFILGYLLTYTFPQHILIISTKYYINLVSGNANNDQQGVDFDLYYGGKVMAFFCQGYYVIGFCYCYNIIIIIFIIIIKIIIIFVSVK